MLFYENEDKRAKNTEYYLNRILKTLYRNGGELTKSRLWDMVKSGLAWEDYEQLLSVLVKDKKIVVEQVQTKTKPRFKVVLQRAWQ